MINLLDGKGRYSIDSQLTDAKRMLSGFADSMTLATLLATFRHVGSHWVPKLLTF
jgi:hypothetical protein